MPNPVIIADLEARFRPLDGSETNVAQALLDDAWATLLAVIPDLEDRIATGSTSVNLAVSVVSAMALRVLRNPNGVRSWSVDDYSETRDNSLSSGALYASPEEVRMLSGQASVTRRGAFSVGVSPEPSRAPGSESELIDYLRYGSRW